MTSFSSRVALRYLWSRRSEAFITILSLISVLGVAIGVMVICTVMAIMTGFEHELRDKLASTQAHVVVNSIGGRITHWGEIKQKIATIPEVASVSAFTYHQALLKAPGRSSGVLIRGVEPSSGAAKQLAEELTSKGTAEQLFSPQPVIDATSGEPVNLAGIIVGRELAKMYGLYQGSIISLLSPQVSSSPFGLIPKYRRFQVVGTFTGLPEFEKGLGFLSLSEAQQFFKMDQAVSGLEVRLNDIDKAPQIAKTIVDKIGGFSEGLYATDWTESNQALWRALRLEKMAYFIVLLLIIVMASFSIISTLVMIVLEKRRDIAVMMTMGASSRAVARIFIIQGAVIGLVGTLSGLALGLALSLGLRHYGFPLDESIFGMSQLPIRIQPINFALAALCAFAICCLATIYPARRASSLEPSEVLRH